MDVSIGVFAHNEQDKIKNILDVITNQQLDNVNIKEIIVVSSSTDDTNSIVKKYNVSLIKQRPRTGKAYAINKFLAAAKSENLVICSGDIVPRPDSIEKLCAPLQDHEVGIVACRPIPIPENHVLGKVIALQWYVHHKISLIRPKYGEMIAFRRLFNRIENTAADEEFIAMLVQSHGCKGAYAHEAIVYNTGPCTYRGFLKQKRRIHWGHLELKKKYRYRASSIIGILVFREYLKCFSIRNAPTIFLAGALEMTARSLGILDYLVRRNHYVWEIVKTTDFEK